VTVSLPAFRIREDPVSFDEVLKRRGTLRAYPIGMQLLDEFTKGVSGYHAPFRCARRPK